MTDRERRDTALDTLTPDELRQVAATWRILAAEGEFTFRKLRLEWAEDLERIAGALEAKSQK